MDRNIDAQHLSVCVVEVALRKESVDRNILPKIGLMLVPSSLSARRAWIEIVGAAEGAAVGYCRSPQGERG